MSKDKHKGVARRKFVLANLPFQDGGKRKIIYGFKPDPSPAKGYKYRPHLDVTKEVRQLEKAGLIKRVRESRGLSNRHIKRTLLTPKK